MVEAEALEGLRARQPRTGSTIEATALRLAQRVRATPPGRRGAERTPYLHSYDMLGEAARTAADAAHYMELYARAIGCVRPPDTISIKLSALHPRFEEAKRARVFVELLPKLKTLAQLATE